MTGDILVMDDNPGSLNSYVNHLKGEGFNVVCTQNWRRAIEEFDATQFDVAILDVDMSDSESDQDVLDETILKMSSDYRGIDIARYILDKSFWTDVIFISGAKTELSDRLLGYSIGGDDYRIKGISAIEFTHIISSRIRNVMRFDWSHAKIGDVNIDLPGQKIINPLGEEQPITGSEVIILRTLLTDYPRLSSKEALHKNLKGDGSQSSSARTVDMLVHKLRKKMTTLGITGASIINLRGQGYRLEGSVETY